MHWLSQTLGLILILILPSPVFLESSATFGRRLISAQVIFRHGHREPDDSFEHPLGKLTSRGKRQMNELGQFLRRRYGDFVAEEYLPGESCMISSDTDRTLISGHLVTHSLYKDFNEKARWSSPQAGSGRNAFDYLPFEPIPVRSVPEEIDDFIHMTKPCPRHDELLQVSFVQYIDDFVDAHWDFFNRYARQTGDWNVFQKNLGPERIQPFTYFQERAVYNKSVGIRLEDSALECVDNPELLSFKPGYDALYVDTEEKQKLLVGPLLRKLTLDFQVRQSTCKLKMYSGHDRNLYALMITLGLWPDHTQSPPYGSALFRDLYEGPEEGQNFVEFWYRSGTDLYEMQIPGCNGPCNVSEFLRIFHSLLEEEDCSL